MRVRFENRTQAGRVLGTRLKHYSAHPHLIVLGLPRGGVPVAHEVARALSAPLDVFVVRKLGVPAQEELAMGALASGGIRILNPDVIEQLSIPPETIEEVTLREQRELSRREHLYRGNQQPPSLRGKTVILVDDGIATGSTMKAAVRAIRSQSPDRIVIATPTASPTACTELEGEVEELLALMTPHDFEAVGRWYEDFSQTTDDVVAMLLRTEASPLPNSNCG